MIAICCPTCDSPHLRKNGRTASGQQKYHCTACNRYDTLETRAAARQHQQHLVEHLHSERVSQRGIARITGVSRTTIITWLKKSR